MQKQDLEILYSFVLGQMYSFIEFCKERGLSECEADRIVEELEEQANE
ncbi:hypothetical protein RCS94_03645 [Orbaceae bacterium ac157xtp]